MKCEHKIKDVKYYGQFCEITTCVKCGRQYLVVAVYWPLAVAGLVVLGLALRAISW